PTLDGLHQLAANALEPHPDFEDRELLEVRPGVREQRDQEPLGLLEAPDQPVAVRALEMEFVAELVALGPAVRAKQAHARREEAVGHRVRRRGLGLAATVEEQMRDLIAFSLVIEARDAEQELVADFE